MPISVDSKKWGPDYVQGVSPSNPKHGMTWFDKTDNKLKIYNGNTSTWNFITNKNFGYIIAGGNGASYTSYIQRMNFSSDSLGTKIIGNLSYTTSSNTGFNSSKHGYSITGSTLVSIISRIEFPFDSGIVSNVGNTNPTIVQTSGFNSSNYGYIAGGEDNSSNRKSSIFRLTFPFDSGTMGVNGNINQSKRSTSTCNSSNHGFICGGSYTETIGFEFSNIDRVTFPFDSGTSNNVGNLTTTKNLLWQQFNSSIHGFITGGYYTNSSTYLSSIDRITFPFDSGTANSTGNLNQSKATSGFNSTQYGFTVCGYNGSYLSSIERITFPFDSGTSTLIYNLFEQLTNSKCSIDNTDFVLQFI